MWPELDVLMPLHFGAALGSFEVQFRVMELDIRANEIRDDIQKKRRGRVIPVGRVVIARAGKAAEFRPNGAVTSLEIPDSIGFCQVAGLFDLFGGHTPESLDDVERDHPLKQQIPILEIEFS